MAAKMTPMDFIVEALKKDKNAVYADIHAAAGKRGMKIYPIMYGRAKALLGLVPVKPRGEGKARVAKAAAAARAATGTRSTPAKRGPGRPPKTAAMGSLEAVIAALRDGERERDRYRRALEQIRHILGAV
ncbi:MAG: hypothetical protein IPM13_17580 [Phycisphaerales bacterium]|nr:hypothetical protein [Phycisphaerales bacterium]